MQDVKTPKFKLYSQLYPDMPKMCGEYWSGWFDYWGRPHQIVIDLGEEVKISGFRCLPRTDNSEIGVIKDFKFYAKSTPFKF